MTLLSIFGGEIARAEQQQMLLAMHRFSGVTRRALQFIRAHKARSIGLDDIAAAANVLARNASFW